MSKAVLDRILVNFPEASDCINGHLGPEVKNIEAVEDDDRYIYLSVTRCEHCGMSLREEYPQKVGDLTSPFAEAS